MKIFLGIVALLLTLSFLVWFFGDTNSGDVVQTPTSTSPFPIIDDQNQSSFNIASVSHAREVSPGFWHIDGTVTNNEAGFEILYNEPQNSFAINIYKEPLAEYRSSASQYFLLITGFTEAEACLTNVYVGVTADFNDALSRQNLGLSFCPNSVDLN